MENISIALGITVLYFLVTVVFEGLSRSTADRASSLLRVSQQRPFGRMLYNAIKFFVLFVMTWMLLVGLIKATGSADVYSALGLERTPRKGKVILTIPRNVMGAGVDISEPYVHYRNSPSGKVYGLIFKFKIYKGAKDKELKITGGRFLIRSLVSGQTMDEQKMVMDGGFVITDQDITGTYVSPQPFVLPVEPEEIQFVWEMDRADSTKIVSKPYQLKPLLLEF